MNTTHSSSSSPSIPLPCPRCKSNDTKFCYYNNYNLMQPRHFCRSCRRYWTHGGTLRNVPVGGGSRKTKQADSIAQTNSKPQAVAYDSLQNYTSWNPNPSFQVLNAQTPVGAYSYLRQQRDVEPTSHFENDREELGFDSGMNQYELDPLPESLSVNGSPFCYWK